MTKQKDTLIFAEHLFINCANTIDAIATLLWIILGVAEEANPLMAALIDASPLLFLAVKLTVIPMLSIFLWYHRKNKKFNMGLHFLCVVYAVIIIIHLVIGLNYPNALIH